MVSAEANKEASKLPSTAVLTLNPVTRDFIDYLLYIVVGELHWLTTSRTPLLIRLTAGARIFAANPEQIIYPILLRLVKHLSTIMTLTMG
jgi:hypothetical protein